MAKEINQTNFAEEVLEVKGTVLVDFWAPWCGPCRMQGPIVEDFGNEFPAVKTVKVNVDDNPAIAQQYNIMSIPTLMVFKDGQLATTVVGLHTKKQLEELVK